MFQIPSIARNERGAAAIEYALIAALVALAMLAGLIELGGSVGIMWGDTSQGVDDAM